MTSQIYKHSFSVFCKVEKYPFVVIYAKAPKLLEPTGQFMSFSAWFKRLSDELFQLLPKPSLQISIAFDPLFESTLE